VIDEMRWQGRADRYLVVFEELEDGEYDVVDVAES
jgi:hypothetical protein